MENALTILSQWMQVRYSGWNSLLDQISKTRAHGFGQSSADFVSIFTMVEIQRTIKFKI